MKVQYLILLYFGLYIVGCNPPEANQDNLIFQDAGFKDTGTAFIVSDTFADLINMAVRNDTFEYDNWEPFIFFKSGYFLKKLEKNALLIQCPTDTTYSVRLYSVNNRSYTLCDSVTGIDAFPIQFLPRFEDYNFDGQSDIYIQVTASNGYSMSQGNLIIIDPMTKELQVHLEARFLANMQPLIEERVVISEELIECKASAVKEVGIWTNKWENGVLQTIRKDYPCEPHK